MQPSVLFALVYLLSWLAPCRAASASADGLTDEELERIVDELEKEGFAHGGQDFTISRTKPCIEHRMIDSSMHKAYGRFSKKFVEVDPESKFDMSFCSRSGPDNKGECAVKSSCSTVYQWQKARTRTSLFGRVSMWMGDEVLVPISCMCVIGTSHTPIVLA